MRPIYSTYAGYEGILVSQLRYFSFQKKGVHMNTIKMYKTKSKAGNWIYDSAFSRQCAIGNFYEGGNSDTKRYFISITVDASTLPDTILYNLDTNEIVNNQTGEVTAVQASV